jgi:hypothetical protein
LRGHLTLVRTQRLATELRYREDQPRAPRGNPDGGQWIRDTVHAPNARPHREAVRRRPPAPRCQGDCGSGGSFVTSGWITILGKRYCWNCAIKELGIQELPAEEKPDFLRGTDKTIGE